jgi:hypothetical protein
MRSLLAAIVLLPLIAQHASAQDVYHRGYYRQNGTYVQPHYQTRPDSSIYNNYSTYPNVNPYTGRVGTVNPYNSYTRPSYSYPGYGYKRRY